MKIHQRQPNIDKFQCLDRNTSRIISNTDPKIARKQDGLPPIFLHKIFKRMAVPLSKVFKLVKRIKSLAIRWKFGAVSTVFRKTDRRKVDNYRPVSLLKIMSDFFEKCLYIDLYKHIARHLTPSQQGFVTHCLVITNRLFFF